MSKEDPKEEDGQEAINHEAVNQEPPNHDPVNQELLNQERVDQEPVDEEALDQDAATQEAVEEASDLTKDNPEVFPVYVEFLCRGTVNSVTLFTSDDASRRTTAGIFNAIVFAAKHGLVIFQDRLMTALILTDEPLSITIWAEHYAKVERGNIFRDYVAQVIAYELGVFWGPDKEVDRDEVADMLAGYTQLNGYTALNGDKRPNGLAHVNGDTQPNGHSQPNGFAHLGGDAQPNGDMQPNGHTHVNGYSQSNGHTDTNGVTHHTGDSQLLDDVLEYMKPIPGATTTHPNIAPSELNVDSRGEQNDHAQLDSETLKVRLVDAHARVPVDTLPRLLDGQWLTVNRHNRLLVLGQQAGVNTGQDGGDWHNDKDNPGEEDNSHDEDLHQACLRVDDGLAASLAIHALEQAERACKEERNGDGELLGHGGDGGDGRDGLEGLDGWEAAEPREGRWGGDDNVGPCHADGAEDDHGEDVAEVEGKEGEDDAELAAEEAVHDEHAEAAEAAEEAAGLAEVLEGGADARGDGGLLDEGDLALFEEGFLIQAILLLFGGRGFDQEGGGGLDHGEGRDEVAIGVSSLEMLVGT
ncbi:hypothetical protein V496_01305 [Pseudogymnoascus sp. VKM F-4515 (FW-2607)]|nr:hypothetical protein V496_01305 [Pseudogymnoascus sp. VKM F-4515 (FW-2607)]